MVGGAVLLLCLFLTTLYSLPLLCSVTLGFGKVIIDGRKLRPDGLTAVDIAEPAIHRTPVTRSHSRASGAAPKSDRKCVGYSNG